MPFSNGGAILSRWQCPCTVQAIRPICLKTTKSPSVDPFDQPINWEKRIFQNSYTRAGLTHRGRRWSVKFQLYGRRKTFSLPAKLRSEAAEQARSLHNILHLAGWDEAVAAHQSLGGLEMGEPRPDRLSKRPADNCNYWRARLIRRKYPDPLAKVSAELSVRIEHGVTCRYFPLGSSDPEASSRHALEIYRDLRANGWESVLARRRNEFTLAVFWHHNPVVCTYTTLYTRDGEVPSRGGGDHLKTGARVGLIEPETLIASVLSECVCRQHGVRWVSIFSTAAEALGALGNRSVDLLLVNRSLPDLPATTLLRQLKTIHPNLVTFLYGICEDSNQIFASLSGVISGYFLQRRQPDNLFSPIQSAMRPEAFSPRLIPNSVRDYFQGHFDAPAQPDDHDWLEQLTGREQQILNCVAKGYPDKEISHILGISVWTVHNHLKHIYEKLNVHTRTEAVVRSLQK